MHNKKKERVFAQNKRIKFLGVNPVNPVMFWTSNEFYCCDTQINYKWKIQVSNKLHSYYIFLIARVILTYRNVIYKVITNWRNIRWMNLINFGELKLPIILSN